MTTTNDKRQNDKTTNGKTTKRQTAKRQTAKTTNDKRQTTNAQNAQTHLLFVMQERALAVVMMLHEQLGTGALQVFDDLLELLPVFRLPDPLVHFRVDIFDGLQTPQELRVSGKDLGIGLS
jgi:hypothetical protein